MAGKMEVLYWIVWLKKSRACSASLWETSLGFIKQKLQHLIGDKKWVDRMEEEKIKNMHACTVKTPPTYLISLIITPLSIVSLDQVVHRTTLCLALNLGLRCLVSQDNSRLGQEKQNKKRRTKARTKARQELKSSRLSELIFNILRLVFTLLSLIILLRCYPCMLIYFKI